MTRCVCALSATVDFFRGLVRGAKVYLPVHGAPFLLFKARKLPAAPVAVVVSFLKALAYSSAFISAYTFTVKMTMCSLRHGMWCVGARGVRGVWRATSLCAV